MVGPKTNNPASKVTFTPRPLSATNVSTIVPAIPLGAKVRLNASVFVPLNPHTVSGKMSVSTRRDAFPADACDAPTLRPRHKTTAKPTMNRFLRISAPFWGWVGTREERLALRTQPNRLHHALAGNAELFARLRDRRPGLRLEQANDEIVGLEHERTEICGVARPARRRNVESAVGNPT